MKTYLIRLSFDIQPERLRTLTSFFIALDRPCACVSTSGARTNASPFILLHQKAQPNTNRHIMYLRHATSPLVSPAPLDHRAPMGMEGRGQGLVVRWETAIEGTSPAPGGAPTSFGRARGTTCSWGARNWSKNVNASMSASSTAERISASNAGSVSVARHTWNAARGGGR